MIIQKQKDNNISLGFDDNKSFNVTSKRVNKVFKLLSNSVYTDKEGSITREIFSNGFDSNVMSGNSDKPVILKYDASTEIISIQDFGEGMSPHFVNNGYSEIGESTKEDSEDTFGHYGIGRISVFSYTDHYMLTTVYENIKYNYVISKNSEGTADIDLLDNEYTEENNGTTVSFKLLSTYDFSKFKKAAENQLKYFDNAIIEGFGIDNNYIIYKGKYFRWRSDRSNVNGLELCFGNVNYPIDWSKLGMNVPRLNCALYLPLNSGITPIASKEALEYNDFTINLIKETYNKCLAELKEYWAKDKDCNTLLSFNKKLTDQYIRIDNESLYIGHVVTDLKYDVTYTPINDLEISKTKFLSYYFDVVDRVIVTLRKKDSSHIIHQNNDIYITENDNYSNYKASRIGYNKIVKKGIIDYEWLISRLYESTDIEVKSTNLYNEEGERIYEIVNHKEIDYKTEIDLLVQQIYDEILPKCIDFDTFVLPKVQRNYGQAAKITKNEIRAVVLPTPRWTNIDRTKKVIDLNSLKSKTYVIYTSDKAEFHQLADFIRYNQDKPKYIEFFYCAASYHKKLELLDNTYTVEEFWKSTYCKRRYLNNFYNELRNLCRNVYTDYNSNDYQSTLVLKYYSKYKSKGDLSYGTNIILKDIHYNESLGNERKKIEKALSNIRSFNTRNECRYYKLYQFYKNKNKQK